MLSEREIEFDIIDLKVGFWKDNRRFNRSKFGFPEPAPVLRSKRSNDMMTMSRNCVDADLRDNWAGAYTAEKSHFSNRAITWLESEHAYIWWIESVHAGTSVRN